MSSSWPAPLSRRSFLRAGALTVAFAMAPKAFAELPGASGGQALRPDLPGDLKSTPMLDAWIRIDADGAITVFTGKAELGQGIKTALIQVAAEELDVDPATIKLVTADTARTPDEGLTAASHSMQDSGTAIMNAAANVRMRLTDAAANTLDVDPATLSTSGEGHVLGGDGKRLSYGAIAASLSLHVEAQPNVPLRDPASYRTIGKSWPRVDIPAKLTGGAAYVQDLRLPGMLHARILRGPSGGTRLKDPPVDAVARMPGVVRIVQNSAFLAVIAKEEWAAIAAMRALQAVPFERTAPALPQTGVAETLTALPSRPITVLETSGLTAAPVRTVTSRYTRPWLAHGSIGPSCAVAWLRNGEMTIWSHSQGIFDVRRVAADLLGLDIENVHAIHAEGAGCYGQNGADDVAADAALIAHELPGHPIRLQWMREQEFGWEPLGPGMFVDLEAAMDDGNRIVSWRHDVWSTPHNTRPNTAGGVLAGWEVSPPFKAPEPQPIPMPEGGGDRNSNPLYALPTVNVVYHFVPTMPMRTSAMRSLGGHVNIFAIEQMFDELAATAGVDPLALRLAHMLDERARDVMTLAAERFGWANRQRGDGRRGCGMGFAQYKNLEAYCAVVMEVEVERETGDYRVKRAVAAVDCGQAVNPDAVANQIEGAIIQSISWTGREAVTTKPTHQTSFDWSTYPILRFDEVPDVIDVHIVDRPGMPFLGTAEAGQAPAGAALANALADAIGIRLRDMPLTPKKVKAAIGVI